MFIKGAITALVTPMKKDSSIDYESLKNLINHQISNGINGIVAVGTTGESATIDFEDHIKLIEFFVKVTDNRVPIIAGTGANSTEEALTLTKAAESIGADAALLVSPYYNKPPQEGIIQHHLKIADEANIPQILYNVPSRTASFIEPSTVSTLAKHENIICIKDATGDMKNLDDLKRLCSKEVNSNNFYFYSGDDFTSLEFLKLGGHGTISVSSNVAPKIVSEICECFKNDFKKAELLDSKLKDLNENLFSESNPIPVKWALHKIGLIDKGIRLPLVELSEEFKEPLEKCLIELDLI